MPVYEYRCEPCERTFEAFLRRPDERVACPKCGGRSLTKLFSVFGVGRPGGDAPPAEQRGGCGSCGCGSCACGE